MRSSHRFGERSRASAHSERLCRCGFNPTLQQDPEDEPVSDQHQGHQKSRDEEGGAQFAGNQPDAGPMMERIQPKPFVPPDVAKTLDSIGREASRAALRQIMTQALECGLLEGDPTNLRNSPDCCGALSW